MQVGGPLLWVFIPLRALVSCKHISVCFPCVSNFFTLLFFIILLIIPFFNYIFLTNGFFFIICHKLHYMHHSFLHINKLFKLILWKRSFKMKLIFLSAKLFAFGAFCDFFANLCTKITERNIQKANL